jgi:hypothetical protein
MIEEFNKGLGLGTTVTSIDPVSERREKSTTVTEYKPPVETDIDCVFAPVFQ